MNNNPYRSREEKFFAEIGPALVAAEIGGQNASVFSVRYEKHILVLPGGRYTPDFKVVVQLEDGSLVHVFVE
jgi:hypothetical protein